VVELTQRFAFAHEALYGFGVSGNHIRVEGFDRHRFPGLGIGRPVHIAHTAPAQQVLLRVADLKAVGDEWACAHDILVLP